MFNTLFYIPDEQQRRAVMRAMNRACPANKALLQEYVNLKNAVALAHGKPNFAEYNMYNSLYGSARGGRAAEAQRAVLLPAAPRVHGGGRGGEAAAGWRRLAERLGRGVLHLPRGESPPRARGRRRGLRAPHP